MGISVDTETTLITNIREVLIQNEVDGFGERVD